LGYSFNFAVVLTNWPYLVSGVGTTLMVTFASLIAGLAIGLIIALLRLSSQRVLSAIGWLYVAVLRNTPALVQLMWVYYCLPILTGVELNTAASCIVALALHGGAYIGEIIRGGIRGVDPGQVEAGRTIGLSRAQVTRKIVLPQAIRRMLAPLVNEAVTILKFSALVSVLGVADLMYQGQTLATTTFRPLEIFTFVALEYLALCSAFSFAASLVERRFAVAD
jgi:His/Glu/Gln/Arg/opine family amino acid ABC transporter permease subunit